MFMLSPQNVPIHSIPQRFHTQDERLHHVNRSFHEIICLRYCFLRIAGFRPGINLCKIILVTLSSLVYLQLRLPKFLFQILDQVYVVSLFQEYHLNNF